MDQLTYDSLAHVTNLITSENKDIDEMYKAVSMDEADAAVSERIADKVQASLDADVA